MLGLTLTVLLHELPVLDEEVCVDCGPIPDCLVEVPQSRGSVYVDAFPCVNHS